MKLQQTKDYLLLADEEAEIISQKGLYTDGINIPKGTIKNNYKVN